MTQTQLSDDEFSLDGGDDRPDQDNSVALVTAARQSLNLPATSNTRKTTNSAKRVPNKDTGSRKSNSAPSKQPNKNTGVKFLNSEKWSKEMRPPHLEDDEVFNSLSVEAAANHIMQWMTTKTMMTSNELKEKRSRSMMGREKPDEDIKKRKIEAGDDDAISILHKQRFSFRTPLKEPKEYWHLVPLKWPEVNKSIYLESIGMDNICSPKTIELLHDRSSPLEIKMFMTINISVGRAGMARKQNLRTLEDGTTEVVCADDWLSPTNINQIIEALDNMVAIWTLMWPGEWSMVTLRRAVTKHLAFGEISNPDLRKRMLESLMNEVLSSNASLAARGKPPMEFDKIDKLATRYLDNKKHFEKTFKIEPGNVEVPRDPKKQKSKALVVREEVKELKKSVGNRKTISGKEICFWFNTSKGCRSTVCRFEHGCCAVKEGGKDLCGGNHKKSEHRRK